MNTDSICLWLVWQQSCWSKNKRSQKDDRQPKWSEWRSDRLELQQSFLLWSPKSLEVLRTKIAQFWANFLLRKRADQITDKAHKFQFFAAIRKVLRSLCLSLGPAAWSDGCTRLHSSPHRTAMCSIPKHAWLAWPLVNVNRFWSHLVLWVARI